MNDVRGDVGEISAKAFAGFQELIFKAAGITMLSLVTLKQKQAHGISMVT